MIAVMPSPWSLKPLCQIPDIVSIPMQEGKPVAKQPGSLMYPQTLTAVSWLVIFQGYQLMAPVDPCVPLVVSGAITRSMLQSPLLPGSHLV